jgi:two-component system, cell cycle response regulator
MSANILIIEDNPTNMELMAYLLTNFGYEVRSAPEGRSGIEIALKIAPDLIICDIEMPGLSGFDVLRALREHEQTKRLPMIAVTAYAMVGDREKVLAAGFDGYVSKPIDPETFVREVEEFLPPEKRSSRQPEAHAVVAATPQPGHSANALILVVDDSPVNLTLIKSTLEPSGYRVITAESVDAGLKLTRHYAFDLILSDLHMSPASGLDFLQLAKANPGLCAIPFLMCTSSRIDDSDGADRRALDLGADRFLSRPIVPERLLAEVAACLKSRESRQKEEMSVGRETSPRNAETREINVKRH